MRILMMGAPYLARAFAERGDQVLTVGHVKATDIPLNTPITSGRLQELCGDFRPDLFCYFDDGNMPLLIDPENLGCPSVFYSIDSYCNPWHFPYAAGFDLALVAQKDFLPLFKDESPDAAWFPLFCSAPRESAPYEADFSRRDVPVAFVGTLGHKNNPDRAPFLKRFRQVHPLFLYSGDYRPIFARSRIILNQTAFAEINFRCFEAMASGCALLMEKCDNGFNELFAPALNILPPYTRGDYQEAAAIASEWLAQPEKLAAVAKAGREHALARHSDRARAASLEEIAAPLLAGKRGAEKSKKRACVRTAFGILAAELTTPELEPHRKFFYELATS